MRDSLTITAIVKDGTADLSQDQRACRLCGATLARHMYPTGPERIGAFRRREFCGRKCRSQFRSQSGAQLRNENGEKRCNKCQTWLSTEQYYRHPDNPDGLSYKCIGCSRLLNRENLVRKHASISRKRRYAYRMDHHGVRTKMIAYQRAYRERNHERILFYHRQYGAISRSFSNAKISAYRKTPIGRFKSRQKQIKRQRQIVGSFTHEEWQALLKRFPFCLACRTPADQCKITVDHVVPICLGGLNVIGNIQPLCRRCNSVKQAKIIDYRPLYD